MQRHFFLKSVIGVAALTARPFDALAALTPGGTTTQAALFALLPRPKSGNWVRLIMGAGVEYQKQIGAATESTEHGELRYLETQVGVPGGSCNPNTMKRTYLSASTFPSLFEQTPVLANVANSGTTLTRWADTSGGQTGTPMDAKLRMPRICMMNGRCASFHPKSRLCNYRAAAYIQAPVKRREESSSRCKRPISSRPLHHRTARSNG